MESTRQRKNSDEARDSRYPPINDYAIIGDCRTAALVSRDGSIDWLCLPHFSAPAVFSAIIDQRIGGRFRIRSTGTSDRVSRRYVGNSNVLETRFESAHGTFSVTDCMPVLTGRMWQDSLQPQRELLRIVACHGGQVELEVLFQPRPNYARACVRLKPRGTLGWACSHQNHQLILHTDRALQLAERDTSLSGRIRLQAGEKCYFSLTYVQHDIAVIAPLGDAAQRRLDATRGWWERWAEQCSYQGPYRKAVMRSLLALKLMTYQLSGAVIAAPTTSLPEHIGGVRNWDYRYCWLRDAALTFRAFADMGYTAEAEAFIDWLLHATRLTRPKLQVMYDVYGETRLVENTLDHLEGYRGSRPVRIGNAAHLQLQLDTYGALVLAVYDYLQRGGGLDSREARVLVSMGRFVCRNWMRPDKGIWELRGKPRHNTHSKLMCWVALDRLLRLSGKGILKMPEARFEAERDKIACAIHTQGYNAERGTYTGAFGKDYVEAGLLLLAEYGFLDANDPRMVATGNRVERELASNGLLFRHKAGLDGLPPGEGAFVICSFWMTKYLTMSGKLEQATRHFEHLLSLANDVGLLAEEADPRDGSALGNFPQAYSHVGLITAAIRLEQAQAPQAAAVAAAEYARC